VRARDFLGVVAAQSLGNFKNVNHINIEEEVKIMLKPLADLIEKKKRNKVFKSFKIAKQITKNKECEYNNKPKTPKGLEIPSAQILNDEYLSDSTADLTSQKSDQLSTETEMKFNNNLFEK